MTSLKKINNHQKHEIRIIYNKRKFESAQELIEHSKIFNIHELNILNTHVFMHRINLNKASPNLIVNFKNQLANIPLDFPT